MELQRLRRRGEGRDCGGYEHVAHERALIENHVIVIVPQKVKVGKALDRIVIILNDLGIAFSGVVTTAQQSLEDLDLESEVAGRKQRPRVYSK